jgi:hypothetical protein
MSTQLTPISHERPAATPALADGFIRSCFVSEHLAMKHMGRRGSATVVRTGESLARIVDRVQ